MVAVVGYESATVGVRSTAWDRLTQREESGAEGSRTLDLLNAIIGRSDSKERTRQKGRALPSSALRGVASTRTRDGYRSATVTASRDAAR
jgi:hypothetical protein